MIYSFLSPRGMLVRTEDGRNSTFEEEIRFVDENGTHFRGPVGSTTDWASTPAVIWAEIPPFGDHARACGIHDLAYRDTLEKLVDGVWVKAFPGNDEETRKACDDLLFDILTCDRVDTVKRDAIYAGVRLGGSGSFRKDRLAVPQTPPPVGI